MESNQHYAAVDEEQGERLEETTLLTGLPRHVVIVRGSLAGLMNAIQLKRHGSRVTILEQDPCAERRQAQAGGIGFGPNMEEFLRRYDLTGNQVFHPLCQMRFSFGARSWSWPRLPARHNLTSWAHLYRTLRANLAVEKEGSGLGSVVYRAGKHADGIEYPDRYGGVTVHFTDIETGLRDSVSAELVIGADGLHSTVRGLVRASVRKEHSGYIVWRGAVPEGTISSETAQFFASAGGIEMLWQSYMICYIIPTDDGCFDPGHRLINWLWYYNVADDSPDMIDILTDMNGQEHQQTVPAGLVRPEIWARHRETVVRYIAKPYAELLCATTSPFVTKVSDALCEDNIFCAGRVVLAGDSYSAVRPHLTLATEHAA